MGSGSYANFGFTVLDACRVDIGKRVLIGPNVQVRRNCSDRGGLGSLHPQGDPLQLYFAVLFLDDTAAAY
jgi:acetyltransferase-like isoleucine patch superfamily enzyme